jgi:hypothetical protein
MSNTGLRNAFLKRNPHATQKQLPKDLRGEIKAYYYPVKQTDWLLGENKAYQRVVYLDSEGFVTYTYMEAKWVPKEENDRDREQFAYLLCTHLTLHLFCILLGPNYWDHIWAWGPSEESELSVDDRKTHPGA